MIHHPIVAACFAFHNDQLSLDDFVTIIGLQFGRSNFQMIHKLILLCGIT